MKNFDVFSFNVNLIIAYALLLIAAALVYIAFKLSEKKHPKPAHNS